MSAREPLRERIAGRWHGVLPMLGLRSAFLSGKHGPCPLCGGGKDRWRFDDKDGHGTWICNQCGAGDGVSLLMKFNGWDFKTAAEKIEAVIGGVEARATKPKADPREQHRIIRQAWVAGGPIGKAVRRYLLGRGIDAGDVGDLRESSRHEMLALVRDSNGVGCQVHRTLLTADGNKADVEQARLFMPGPIPEGSAVRLMPHDGELGIAEGIETALSAAILFDVPCWAALNTSLLKKWQPPADVHRVVVFGDNDTKFAGHAAAYELARRLATDKRFEIDISVEIPKRADADWNDVLQERARANVSREIREVSSADV